MKNLSYVTALLVSKYDIEFAPGEDRNRVWKDMKDDFTAVPGRLNLVFKLRKHE
jgi:tryprostatin B 6-hydroxylase